MQATRLFTSHMTVMTVKVLSLRHIPEASSLHVKDLTQNETWQLHFCHGCFLMVGQDHWIKVSFSSNVISHQNNPHLLFCSEVLEEEFCGCNRTWSAVT